MALFGRESDADPTTKPSVTPPRQPASRPARKTTLIAAGATLVGEISGDTDVMVEGTVEGKLKPSQDVTVGEQGVVRGEISARRVRVAGRVQGNVRGKESVEILATGSLEGDVSSPGMVIGDGAFFKGRVEMTSGKSEAAVETPKAAAPPAIGSSPSSPAGGSQSTGGSQSAGGSQPSGPAAESRPKSNPAGS
jgi:cytoskeletal protein CcmA (bactofilin family)